MNDIKKIKELAKLIRFHSLKVSSEAGSGHPTSSLSAADLMAGLIFSGVFRYDLGDPVYHNNDRLIFSKGHASPLFYSLWAVAEKNRGRKMRHAYTPQFLSTDFTVFKYLEPRLDPEELSTYRQFGSRLEGHPTLRFPYTEATTGSLGQGLSVGLGMAMNAKYVDKLSYRTYVLLGDSELAEGSVWESAQIASYYKLDNLVAIADINRLGQTGETMYGHDLEIYVKKFESFGWHTIKVDGHKMGQIISAYKRALKVKNKPTIIIAKTLKGKGVSFLEDKNGWHGKAPDAEKLQKALEEIGSVDESLRGRVAKPSKAKIKKQKIKPAKNLPEYQKGEEYATRKAYGNALSRIFPKYKDIVVLDAEVSNSTHAEIFKKHFPKRFFEMFIAEQNMVGTALGFSRRGKTPFVSTFSAFFSRAYDQIRMGQYSDANIKFVGSHAGVSIGEDGASQMGLEDISMFRSIRESAVLYPSDAVSTEALVEVAAKHRGIVYIRTTRMATPVIYKDSEKFPIGGSKTVKRSKNDKVTLIGAGVTLFEALKAHGELKKEGINVRVIDLYSVKPLDVKTLEKAALETSALIVVEDHYKAGGIGEAVASVMSQSKTPVYSMCVKKEPKSGKPEELLDYEEISAKAIVKKVKEIEDRR